jgi:nitrite reductase/ring-hydroxylating ferredoxin subunit
MSAQAIAASGDLIDGGKGVRFELPGAKQPIPAFVIRFDGQVHAYLNLCPHAYTELDWQPGEFFDSAGLSLICATHGAMFEPASGHCVAGPCRGRSLEPVAVEERDGVVYLINQG